MTGASPSFNASEPGGVQLNAVQTLSALGWRYVTRAEGEAQRRGRLSSLVLEDVLAERLHALNSIRQRGRTYPVTDAGVVEAIGRIKAAAADQSDGFMEANRRCTDLLRLGTSIDITVEGETRGRQLRFIDWDEPSNNRFHVTAEFAVERSRGAEHRRPDLVLFVNGIPLTVIEVKNSATSAAQGISQHIRNQAYDEIPHLFATAQILIAANSHEPRYATAGTPRQFWGAWREDKEAAASIPAAQVDTAVNAELDPEERGKIFADFSKHRRRHEGLMEGGGRFATPLDEMLVSLCSPERLLELSRAYTLFDAGIKKVARYQQYFGVKETLRRIDTDDGEGRRRGGVIWHTQGSGKSLTMVMLAQEIARRVSAPRIVLVTDRTDLDDQIRDTFKAVGLEVDQARTGKHLLELVERGKGVITTLIHKFKTALKSRDFSEPSRDIFLLVDESHRSQTIKDDESLHRRMRQVFPNGCYIGFTGTPLLKKERSTFNQFGGLIHSYKIDQAVRDGAVVPLTYEGRHVELDVDDGALDTWFERVTKGLSIDQITDLKRRMARGNEVHGAEAWLREVAYDVSIDFARNWKDTPYRGQLVARRKRDAVMLKRLMDEFGEVTSEVIISDVDEREGHEEANREPDELVVKYLMEVKKTHGDLKKREDQIIRAFKGGAGPDILIVVDKLLTGFDAPRNRVLYIAKPLKEHGLLQAIARVNRVYEDEDTAEYKEDGRIIDYAGILGDLDKALTAYSAFEGYDEADVREALVSLRETTSTLPDKHAALLAHFNGVANTYDEEAYARFLADELKRRDFYALLRDYAKALSTAFSSEAFIAETSVAQLDRYKVDLKRFEHLRRAVARRYADQLDTDQARVYDAKIRKLLDRHVSAEGLIELVPPVNIFDEETFKQAVEDETGSAASVADAIAHATAKTITERLDEDPVLYERFAKLVRDAIEEFRAGRLQEREYLERVKEIRIKVVHGASGEETPASLRGRQLSAAIYRSVAEVLEPLNLQSTDPLVDVALRLETLTQAHVKVGWQDDPDVEKAMRNDMDDYLFDEVRSQLSFGGLTTEMIDEVMDRTIALARRQLAS